MRTSPPIVPRDEDVYLVEVDLGHWGHVWTEADSEATDLETMLTDMLAGQHRNPIRVVAFNVAEGWSRDVSGDLADEIANRCALDGFDVPPFLDTFVDRHCSGRPAQLPLPLRRTA